KRLSSKRTTTSLLSAAAAAAAALITSFPSAAKGWASHGGVSPRAAAGAARPSTTKKTSRRRGVIGAPSLGLRTILEPGMRRDARERNAGGNDVSCDGWKMIALRDTLAGSAPRRLRRPRIRPPLAGRYRAEESDELGALHHFRDVERRMT